MPHNLENFITNILDNYGILKIVNFFCEIVLFFY